MKKIVNIIVGLMSIILLLSTKPDSNLKNNETTPFKCSKKIIRWVNQINTEFPNENLDRVRGEKIKQIVYNLYSDKFFIPVFKEPFENISKRNIKLINFSGSYAACTRSIPGNYGELSAPIKDYLNGRISRKNKIDFSFEKVKEMVTKLRKQRQEIKRIASLLNAPNPKMTWKDLKLLKSSMHYEYKYLLPSEIKYLEKLISSKEVKIAEIELFKNSSQIINMEDSFKKALLLSQFRQSYNELYSKQPLTIKTKLNNEHLEHVKRILAVVIKEEENKLNQLSNKDSDLKKLNVMYLNFNKRYSPFFNLKNIEVINTIEAFKNRKTSIVKSLASQLKKHIQNEVSIESLKKIQKVYLSHTNSSDNTILELNNLINKKKKQIIDYRNKIAQEKAEKERKRKEELRKIASAKALAIENKRSSVIERRRNLRVKYEANLPTIEELFEILNLVPLIRESVRTSDKNKLIGLVESKGYMNMNSKGDLYSDHNTFKNSKGFKIETWRIKSKKDGKMIYQAELNISNVPKDIFELYEDEIVSNYRSQYSSTVNPNTSIIDNKGKAKYFIKSGGTLYRVKLEGKNLEVSAWNNMDANAVAYARRINENTVEVTPWSNFTDIYIKKGDKVKFNASGSIRLGVFSVRCYPDGIEGFRTYNVVDRFKHGSLMGKIGKGPWFSIGSHKAINAINSGYLRLRINDDREEDNNGSFEVVYEIN